MSEKYFPKDMFMYKKMGFSIPLDNWIISNSKKNKK